MLCREVFSSLAGLASLAVRLFFSFAASASSAVKLFSRHFVTASPLLEGREGTAPDDRLEGMHPAAHNAVL